MATNPKIIVRQATFLADGETTISRAASRHQPGKRGRWTRRTLLETWDSLVQDVTGMRDVSAYREALFAHGHGHAAASLALALAANHLRRVLAPSATQFFWPHALADMKLARTAPHHLLEQSTSFDWLWLLVWACLTYALGTLPPLLGQLVTDYCGPCQRGGSMGEGRGRSSRRVTAACVIPLLVASLAWAEHAYVQSCWTLAHVYAYASLSVRGGDEGHAFLRALAEERSAQLTAALVLVASGLHFRVLPAAQLAVRARWPSVLVYAGMAAGTAYVVRHSGWLFVALELTDMWVTFAWIGCAFALHAMEALRARLEAEEMGSGTGMGMGQRRGPSRISKTK